MPWTNSRDLTLPPSPTDCIFPFHAMNNGVQVVFVGNIFGNAATTQGVFISSLDSDNDGIIDFQDNCPTMINPPQTNTDSSLAAAGATVLGDAFGNPCDTDDDNDHFSDTLETFTMTNPIDNCSGTGPGSAGDSWPADVTVDRFIDTADIGTLTNLFGVKVAPNGQAPARYDLLPDPPDPNPDLRFIDTGDIATLRNLFGQGCN